MSFKATMTVLAEISKYIIYKKTFHLEDFYVSLDSERVDILNIFRTIYRP